MAGKTYAIPDDCRYAKSDEWIRLDGTVARVGITDYAQSELSDLVFVELPEVGTQVEAGEAFGIQKSFLVLFMVIIGGLGSIFGSFAGAAFLVLLPVFLKVAGADWFGWPDDIVAHLNLVVVGALIMGFLVFEPHGIAQLWRLA